MPVPFFTDINNDGVDDLLVSPFDPNPMVSEGKESVWLYLNHGSNAHPDFQLYTKSFLQDRMLDFGKGAYPVVEDWDGDGLLDLKVRDFESKVTVLKNVGTLQQPAFELIAVDDKEEWAASCYYDVNQDGQLDLVEGNIKGTVSYYQGNGDGFELISDFWGEVDVRDYQTSYYGYSVPTLFEYHGELLLCVGSEQGKLFLYRVSDDTAFEEVSYLWKEICPEMPDVFGIHSAAAVADLNGDGVLEVVVGNFGGGLQLYNAMIPVNNLGISEEWDDMDIVIFPNPVLSQLHVVALRHCERNAVERGNPQSTKVDCFAPLRSARNDVRVMDLFGRVLIEQEITDSETVLDVSNLAPGAYLLSLDRGLVNRIFLKR